METKSVYRNQELRQADQSTRKADRLNHRLETRQDLGRVVVFHGVAVAASSR
jgi:hypothetical protein